MATNTRITAKSHEKLRKLAKESGQSMLEILDNALEEYRRRHLLLESNKAYSLLRSDSEAWADEMQERSDWNQTIDDGIDME